MRIDEEELDGMFNEKEQEEKILENEEVTTDDDFEEINIEEMDLKVEDYNKHYSAENLWKKIKKLTKKIGLKLTSYVLILYYVLESEEVGKKDKLFIIGCLGYFILPIDIIPDIIPGIGFADDMAVLVLGVRRVIKYVDEVVKTKVLIKLNEWFDLEDDYIDGVLDNL